MKKKKMNNKNTDKMKRTMTKKENMQAIISKEDLYRLVSFIARIDPSIYDFDIINKTDFNPDVHHKASLSMLENCFQNPEQLISMLTDDAMVVYMVTPKEGTVIIEELEKAIEFCNEMINSGDNGSDDMIEYAKILVILKDTINQNIKK